MKKSFLVILLAISVLFTQSAFAESKILIVGDSLSAAYGIDPQKGWVALLQKRITANKLNFTVINDSISGDTTSNGLARLPKSLASYHPVITIIELGGNDGLRGLSLESIKQNLSKMILLAQQNHSQVLLIRLRIPPNYGERYTSGFKNIYDELAITYRVSLVKLFLDNIDNNTTLMQADQIHPTAAAQPLMLENVWPILSPMLTSPA